MSLEGLFLFQIHIKNKEKRGGVAKQEKREGSRKTTRLRWETVGRLREKRVLEPRRASVSLERDERRNCTLSSRPACQHIFCRKRSQWLWVRMEEHRHQSNKVCLSPYSGLSPTNLGESSVVQK